MTATEQIAKLTRYATLKTEGVAALSAPLDVLVIRKSKDIYDIDVNLVVKFGFKIPEIAWNVQEKIKNELENNDINNVEHININIQGVSFKNAED